MHRLLNIYILLTTSILVAEEGSISGQVQDSSNPLYGANVFIVGTSMGSTTDSSGSYQIFGIPVGKYTLQVDYIGYESASIDFYISEQDEASEDLSESNFSAKLGLENDLIDHEGLTPGMLVTLGEQKILNLNDKTEPYYVIIDTTLNKKSVSKILNRHIKNNYMLR